jgi:hypothetical protein
MKKPYQIESQRAVKRLEEMAAEGNPTVQMVLPMAEMIGWLRRGVGELIRQAGLQLIGLLMEEEVGQLVGERSHYHRTETRYSGSARYALERNSKRLYRFCAFTRGHRAGNCAHYPRRSQAERR